MKIYNGNPVYPSGIAARRNLRAADQNPGVAPHTRKGIEHKNEPLLQVARQLVEKV